MDPTAIVQFGKVICNAGGIGAWRWVILAVFILLVGFIVWALFFKADVQPNEHALRKTFNRYKFRWFDNLEETPELRQHLYNLRMYRVWREDCRALWGIWWKARMKRRENRLAAKQLRNSPDGNRPHLQLRYGKPCLLGPGWHGKGFKDKISSIDVEDTRNRVVDLTLYVMEDNGFRVFVLPIQLTIRIADLYLWKQTCNVVEGGVLGVARQKSREILKLGYEVIRNDAESVAEKLMEAMSAKFKPNMSFDEWVAALEGKIEWYGAEAVFVNPAAPEYHAISFVAQALSETSPGAAADFKTKGAAVTAAMSIVDEPSGEKEAKKDAA